MEIDEDLDEDPIKGFLKFKLEEIKFKNEKLREQLQKKKLLLQQCLQQIATKTKPNLKIQKLWQKLIGEKLVIGIDFEKNAESVEDVTVVLQWDRLMPIYYSVKLFTLYNCDISTEKPQNTNISKLTEFLANEPQERSNYSNFEWIESQDVLNRITITMNIPDFSENPKCNFEGIVTFKVGGDEFQIPIPPFSISVSHMYDTKLEILDFDILDYKEEAILALLAISGKVEMIFHISDEANERNLDKVFESCRNFKRVSVAKGLYFVKDVSRTCLGPLVKILKEVKKEIYIVQIYFGRNKDLEFLLHHFFENIPHLTVIPKSIDVEYVKDGFQVEVLADLLSKNKENINSVLRKLGESMEAEVRLLESVLTQNLKKDKSHGTESELESNNEDLISFSVNKDDYFKLRNDLVELETNTEFLYAHIKNIPVCDNTQTQSMIID